MSIKDIFEKNKNKDSVLHEKGQEDIFERAESIGNIKEKTELNQRFIPLIDFSNPSEFVKFGSAENYYSSSIQNILNEFPYDGSRKEINEFLKKSSYLDLYLLENKYPRTNGHIIFSSNGWGTQASTADGYGLPTTQEYISLVGTLNTASTGMTSQPLAKTFDYANRYDLDVYDTEATSQGERKGTRTNNLLFDTSKGITVEFWMKKSAFNTALTQKEVIFDLWNGEASSSVSYGRYTVFLSGSSAANVVKATVVSGTTGGTINYPLGSDGSTSITTSSVADGNWHHYAFTLKSDASNIYLKNYIDGKLANSITSAISIGSITGSMKARIGALIASPSGSSAQAGAGKLSASLDEFRYWKVERTDKQIYENYRFQVGGGTNTDVSNTELGVYYKFNEGITGTSSVDAVILDYSGRITNGYWYGYPGSGARNTGSAMVLAGATTTEYLDPVIRSQHPSVTSLLSDLIASGSEYDAGNNASLYYSIPEWIVDEDRSGLGGNNLFNLTQIMSSFMDELYLGINNLSTLRNKQYTSSSFSKPLPFNDYLLESQGFVSPIIFKDAELAEKVFNHDDANHFELDLNDIKNQIYNNIYNNLVYIYKSKGNEKAFRNLFRCFGIDEELVEINLYGNNLRYTYDNRYTFPSIGKKFIDFYKPDNLSANIYHSTSSTLSYVSGNLNTYDLREAGFTSEAEILFPKQINTSSPSYFPINFVSSSLFGFHLPNTSSNTDYTFPASNDISVQVHSIRTGIESPDVYFLISASFGTGSSIQLTSSVFKNVYDNSKWNFAVSVAPSKFGLAEKVNGSSNGTYNLQFYGIHKELDVTINSFLLTQSISFEQGRNISSSPKRFYAGAHRTNFTGSAITKTDIKFGSLRHWLFPLNTASIDVHAQNPFNYGTQNSSRNAFLNQNFITGTYVPEIETLALHWDIETVTSSNSSGKISINDIVSGSYANASRFGTISKISNYIYDAVGDGFLASDTEVVDKVYVNFAKLGTPDEISSYDLVEIKDNDTDTFTRETRPVNYYFTFELSPYKTISKDVMNIFSSIKEFHNLYHQPVQRYRYDYKELKQLRELYFEKIGETPDIERYLNYYRWIDSSLSDMIRQLVPLTMDTSNKVLTVIESHALDRQNITYPYPLLKYVSANYEGRVHGISELLYSWKKGSAPVNHLQNNNCNWWYQRAERSDSPLSSSNNAVNTQKENIRRITQTYTSGSGPLLAKSDGTNYIGSDFYDRNFSQIYRLDISLHTKSKKDGNIDKVIHVGQNPFKKYQANLWKSTVNKSGTELITISEFAEEKDCSDD